MEEGYDLISSDFIESGEFFKFMRDFASEESVRKQKRISELEEERIDYRNAHPLIWEKRED